MKVSIISRSLLPGLALLLATGAFAANKEWRPQWNRCGSRDHRRNAGQIPNDGPDF
jgi:hypothetical protein